MLLAIFRAEAGPQIRPFMQLNPARLLSAKVFHPTLDSIGNRIEGPAVGQPTRCSTYLII